MLNDKDKAGMRAAPSARGTGVQFSDRTAAVRGEPNPTRISAAIGRQPEKAGGGAARFFRPADGQSARKLRVRIRPALKHTETLPASERCERAFFAGSSEIHHYVIGKDMIP